MPTIKSIEKRFAQTDKTFREIVEKEQLSSRAKNARLREAREAALKERAQAKRR